MLLCVQTRFNPKQPWTLFQQGGTKEVPFLSDLQYTQAELVLEEPRDKDSAPGDIRAAWKEYLRGTLPHAYTQIRNFMLASIAEGRNFEDEENSFQRGEAVRCQLTRSDLEQVLAFHWPGSHTSSAQERTSAVQESGATQRVWKGAKLAVQLANLSETKRSETVDKCKNITKICRSVKLSATTILEPEARETTASAKVVTVNWQDRYAAWQTEV